MRTRFLSPYYLLAIFILLSGCSRDRTPQKISGSPLEVLAGNKIFDQFGVDGLRNDSVPGRKLLFANPSSRFALPLDADVKSVKFGFGIMAAALANVPPTQGVEFRVLYKDRSGKDNIIWSRKLNPLTVATDRGQQSATVTVDRSSYDKLIFETLALQDPIACWAFWNDISVEP